MTPPNQNHIASAVPQRDQAALTQLARLLGKQAARQSFADQMHRTHLP